MSQTSPQAPLAPRRRGRYRRRLRSRIILSFVLFGFCLTALFAFATNWARMRVENQLVEDVMNRNIDEYARRYYHNPEVSPDLPVQQMLGRVVKADRFEALREEEPDWYELPDGITGLHLAVVNEFDAIVLDLNLPGMDGLEVCRKLRSEARKQTPVLMLTARDSLENKLAGFDSGADDYLIKPFALQEVEVRLQALQRRGKAVQTRVLEVGDVEYNLDTLEVRRGGKLLQLNPTALKILQSLMEASPAVVTRQELETRVWGEELPDSDSLRVHIHGLRAMVDKPFPTPMIQTRHGIGYRIAQPDGGN